MMMRIERARAAVRDEDVSLESTCCLSFTMRMRMTISSDAQQT
jgi:hypothetical protein